MSDKMKKTGYVYIVSSYSHRLQLENLGWEDLQLH